jgi:enoyl-CoA hydratase
MAFDNITVDHRDGVAYVRIDRPDVHNAMDAPTRQEIRDAFEAAVDDDSVRCIVMGSQHGAFSSGADLEAVSEMDAEAVLEFSARHGEGLYSFVERVPKPTVAAIDGWALGGGTEISLAFDFRLATTESKFGLTEMRVGLYPFGGAIQRLTAHVGAAKAKELVLGADIIDAAEAEEIGLLTEVHDPEGFDERVHEFATDLTEKPLTTYRVAKESVNRAMDIEAGLQFDRVAGPYLLSTDDTREGIEAFLEDREPAFGE